MPFHNPLQWPIGWERASKRRDTKRKAGWSVTINDLDRVTKLLRLQNVQISTDQPVRVDGQLSQASNAVPADPGVAIYFKRDGVDISLACDVYTSVLANLRAIGLALDYLSRMERDGTSQLTERAFTGFKALPEAIVPPPPDRQHRPWWIVLGVAQDAGPSEVKQAYRRAQSTSHPDAGGNDYDFQEVNAAYEEWRQS